MHEVHQEHRQKELSEGRKALQILKENYGNLNGASISFTLTPRPGATISIDLPNIISGKLAAPLAWAIAEVLKKMEDEYANNELNTESVKYWLSLKGMPVEAH